MSTDMLLEDAALEGTIAWAYPEIIRDISATTTDAQVADLYDRYRDMAAADGYTLHDGLYNCMIEYRNDRRAEV